MDVETLEAQLGQIEWRVAYYEMNVADQIRQIAELERHDRDSGHASARLKKLTEMLSQEIAQHDDLKRQLKSARASNAR
jgi:predicted RNase H-like nuclease (RuvC/YqgF family)